MVLDSEIGKAPIIHPKKKTIIWLLIKKITYFSKRFKRLNKAIGQVKFDICF